MKIITIYLIIFFTATAVGQDVKNTSFNMESKVNYGFIIPHRTGIKNLILGHVRAFEIKYDQPTYGHKNWEQLYNYPSWGISIYAADLANPVQLGYAAGIYPYLRLFPVKKKHVDISYHFGWGLGYITRTFDRKENYKNIVIGSKLNAIIGLGIDAKWRINKRLSLFSGISFTHFSNGAFAIPNLGINIPALTAGVGYCIGDTGKKYIRDSLSPSKKQFYVSYVLSGGLKGIYPHGSKEKYPAFSFNAQFGARRFHKNQFLTGIDFFYNTALFAYYKKYKIDLENNSDIIQTGISFAYMANISRLQIITGMGAYIYTKYKLDGPFYHRIGMRYLINDHFFVNLSLKTHFFKADFSEWGIGYRL